MIVEALIGFLYAAAESLFSGLSALLPEPPEFYSGSVDALGVVLAAVGAPIRDFVPFGPMVTIAILYTSLLVGLGLVRLARRLVSLGFGGGGAA
jgi:hypothetical protein